MQITAWSTDKIWHFNPEIQKAYQLVLNLQPDLALAQLGKVTDKSQDLYKTYLLALNETIDVLITEDPKKFEQLEINFKQRLEWLDKMNNSPEVMFLQAELNLQKGFNLLNMGQEFNAVFAIRRAYNITHDCIKKYPDFVPIKKTYGVLQVMLGSVPEKYSWFMGLLGMRGTVAVGQRQLAELRNSKSSLNQEATILLFTVKGFINQLFGEAAKGMLEYLKEQPDNRLGLFITINMLMKDSQSEKALELFQTLEKNNQGLPMYYADYLHGDALLQKGEYQKAIGYYQEFQKGYRSQSFKKDSYYKVSICYWLLDDATNAKINFDKAKTVGKESAEPDKYAAKQLEERQMPNQKLLKARFATDGGYYEQAAAALQSIGPTELRAKKEQAELLYRKARLAHKTHDNQTAKTLYLQCIDFTKDNPWYFAPNSALQLGYMAQEQKDFAQAKKYFEQALTYKRHEYKNSIDSKAKFALEQIKNASKG
ncbi:MAG: tetratricopeptide repeat protein [Flammeovirgaceae bacterium]